MQVIQPIWRTGARLIRQAPLLGVMIVAALGGIGISLYLTAVHNQAALLICSTSGLIDCASVLASPYSVVPGTSVPITMPGLLWFSGVGGLAVASGWHLAQGRRDPQPLRQALVWWSFVGLATVMYLVFTEIVQLHRLCAWCTGVHLLTLAITLAAQYRLTEPLPVAPRARAQTNSGGTPRPAHR